MQINLQFIYTEQTLLYYQTILLENDWGFLPATASVILFNFLTENGFLVCTLDRRLFVRRPHASATLSC